MSFWLFTDPPVDLTRLDAALAAAGPHEAVECTAEELHAHIARGLWSGLPVEVDKAMMPGAWFGVSCDGQIIKAGVLGAGVVKCENDPRAVAKLKVSPEVWEALKVACNRANCALETSDTDLQKADAMRFEMTIPKEKRVFPTSY